MFFCSVRTRGNFSPARNVRSTTEPDPSDFSFVRTNAPPLPGFTCWNSTIRHVCPSSSMCMPFRNWFVETTSATARGYRKALADLDELPREAGQDLERVLAHDREILDPDAAEAGQVDARLNRHAVSHRQRVRRLGRKARRL